MALQGSDYYDNGQKRWGVDLDPATRGTPTSGVPGGVKTIIPQPVIIPTNSIEGLVCADLVVSLGGGTVTIVKSGYQLIFDFTVIVSSDQIGNLLTINSKDSLPLNLSFISESECISAANKIFGLVNSQTNPGCV